MLSCVNPFQGARHGGAGTCRSRNTHWVSVSLAWSVDEANRLGAGHRKARRHRRVLGSCAVHPRARSVSARHSSVARQFGLRYNSEVVQLNARGHSVVSVASEVAM